MKQVTVQPNADKAARVAAFNDPVWAQLRTATPAQIDTYLNTNVTTLAQARVVLRILILAMRYVVLKSTT